MEQQIMSEILCPICHDCIDTNFDCAENNVQKTICAHYFHSNCINAWLEKNSTCPVCRTKIKDVQDNISDLSSIDGVEEDDDEDLVDDWATNTFLTLSSLIANNQSIPIGQWIAIDVCTNHPITFRTLSSLIANNQPNPVSQTINSNNLIISTSNN